MVSEVEIQQIGLIIVLIAYRIWNTLGGYPEAFYRITRKPYFLQYLVEVDGRISRYVHKFSMIESHSPAKFTFRKLDWFVDNSQTARSNGRPAWFYNYDNSIPIPVIEQSRTKVSPLLIFKAFRNKTVSDMHKLEERKTNLKYLTAFVYIIIIVAVVAGTYYSYNTFCALNPAKC